MCSTPTRTRKNAKLCGLLPNPAQRLAETELLRFSNDPQSGFDSQDLADRELCRQSKQLIRASEQLCCHADELRVTFTPIKQLAKFNDAYKSQIVKLASSCWLRHSPPAPVYLLICSRSRRRC